MSTPTCSVTRSATRRQRMAQLASLFTAAATVEARRKARRNAAKTIRSERDLRELQDQERAAYELARAAAPARDPRFLAQADLLQAARAWSAAAAYADADPEAADAVRRCEERLRALHPYAMAWTTGSAATGPHRSTRCVRRCPCSPAPRTHVPATPLLSAAACRPRTVLARHPGTAARTTPWWPRSLLIPPLPGRPDSAVSRSCGTASPRAGRARVCAEPGRTARRPWAPLPRCRAMTSPGLPVRTARTAWRGVPSGPAPMISAVPRLPPSPAASCTASTSPRRRKTG